MILVTVGDGDDDNNDVRLSCIDGCQILIIVSSLELIQIGNVESMVGRQRQACHSVRAERGEGNNSHRESDKRADRRTHREKGVKIAVGQTRSWLPTCSQNFMKDDYDVFDRPSSLSARP